MWLSTALEYNDENMEYAKNNVIEIFSQKWNSQKILEGHKIKQEHQLRKAFKSIYPEIPIALNDSEAVGVNANELSEFYP